MEKKFFLVKADENNKDWEHIKYRKSQLYLRNNDIRTEFERDYTRILHCLGYRRLKHKTQVFFSPKNDHICTRIEHVNHVASVSSTICKYLGLNEQLASAISLGHDIGHAPFGHHGESCINKLYSTHIHDESFWHEKNSLIFIDNIETLQDPQSFENPLDLTYAVRDGIICHCGEVDENGLKPRKDCIDLESITKPNQVSPFTWEACVVKISDKIAYLGRDIEDAIQYKIIDKNIYTILKNLVQNTIGDQSDIRVNTTVLINDLIVNLCENSTIDNGLCFSKNYFSFINEIKHFNYTYIYNHWKIKQFKKYAKLIIDTIFEVLLEFYTDKHMHYFELEKHTTLSLSFEDWLIRYTDYNLKAKREKKYNTDILFHIADKKEYMKCILTFISGMTDQFAILVYEQLLSF